MLFSKSSRELLGGKRTTKTKLVKRVIKNLEKEGCGISVLRYCKRSTS